MLGEGICAGGAIGAGPLAGGPGMEVGGWRGAAGTSVVADGWFVRCSICSTLLGGAILGSASVSGVFGVSAIEMADARLIR